MGKLTPKDRILKERGLKQFRPAPRKHRKFMPKIQVTYSGKNKTPLMRYLEEKYRVAIGEVLLSGSLSVVAKKLGNEVDATTLSKWIKRFNLRFNKDNLPKCEDCSHHKVTCDLGICNVLIEMEEWDLVLLKKEELTNGSN